MLGGDLAVVSALQGGTIDVSQMNASLCYGLVKEFAVLDFAVLFDTPKEACAVMDGPIGKELTDMLAGQGARRPVLPRARFAPHVQQQTSGDDAR